MEPARVILVDQARPVLEVARRVGRPTWTDLHASDGERDWERDFWTADRVVFSGERLGDPRPFMRRLRDAGRDLVVCTLAADGALALTADGRWIEVQPEPVDTIVDTNGAGDAFVAGTIAGVLGGETIDGALRRGAQTAALADQSADLAAAAAGAPG
jgi:sugar/nucleoside kinase (ribokinase family)